MLTCSNLKKFLYLAYRKAKADIFFSSRRVLALQRFEADLDENLEVLHEALVNGNLDFFREPDFVGKATVVPKNIKVDDDGLPELIFDSSQREWEALTSDKSSNTLITATFRVMENCSIGMHVLSALWVMVIGHTLQKNMHVEPYANRIRETKEGKVNKRAIGSFEQYWAGYQEWQGQSVAALESLINEGKEAISFCADFKSYFHSIPCGVLGPKYLGELVDQNDSLNDLDKTLNKALDVALQSWSRQNGEDKTDIGIPVGLSCSNVIGNLVLQDFDKQVVEEIKPRYYGRYVDDVIIILESSEPFKRKEEAWKWFSSRIDCLNLEKQLPHTTNIAPPDDENFGSNSQHLHQGKYVVTPFALDKSLKLEFNFDKTTILSSVGKSGKQLISTFRRQLQTNKSEWRVLAQVPLNSSQVATDILEALDKEGDPASRPGKTGKLTARRSAFALKLRGFGDLSKNCNLISWKHHRKELYEVFADHVAAPHEIFSYYQYVPRVIELALNSGEPEEARFLIKRVISAIRSVDEHCAKELSPIAFGEANVTSGSFACRAWFCAFVTDMIQRILGAPQTVLSESSKRKLLKELKKAIKEDSQGLTDLYALNPDLKDVFKTALSIADEDDETSSPERSSQLEQLFLDLFAIDLSNVPFSRAIAPRYLTTGLIKNFGLTRDFINQLRDHLSNKSSNYDEAVSYLYTDVKDKKVMNKLAKKLVTESVLSDPGTVSAESQHWLKGIVSLPAIVFPTRAIAVTEVILWSEYLESSVCPPSGAEGTSDFSITKLSELERCILGVRGFSIQNSMKEAGATNFGGSGGSIQVPFDRRSVEKDPVRVAISSIKVATQHLPTARKGSPYRGFDWYRDLAYFIDSVGSLSPAEAKPDYLLLPEVSVPAPWFIVFAQHLASAYGIGLIAGIEYFQGEDTSSLRNQIWASLPTNILGYPIAAIYRQDKQRPAHFERRNLQDHLDQRLVPQKEWPTPPVIEHGDFLFSLLICSELTNIDYRASLRGKVDALFVSEYNKDINSFGALVESAALDIHAYIVQSNDRTFGDSRVRAPMKKSHQRDVARIRGGLNDHFVVAELDVRSLRSFQSYGYKEEPFKPLPDGFQLNEEKRHRLP